ncbi:MAG: hypothetical protein A2751_02125 [Candidatus Doudnabacteria bacterium RIFCSPHIGHO2_01_FULL_46_14]|uniref:Uncharacterized protein n=1 Tax=Candidatus Doudnabacteria bacterium RIFCSPHIGHO2_01_FULL_46_14 TaxID=1817824 RepID=A0A1F5NJU4_9BACT|nr:MAG: hypothetical protein A2751_02125 [Candidatus Doudnabacteria bacterium RIFCSPHIGHO2_01_FULL_46_14]
MSKVLAWGNVWVSVKEKSLAALQDKHKVRTRAFWSLGTSFTMLVLSFFKIIPPQVGWGQLIIVLAFGAGMTCLLLRKDQFWITAIVAGSVFWPMWLIAPYWSGIQLWLAQWLYWFSKINSAIPGSIIESAEYALAGMFACLLGIELVRIITASEFVERYREARRFYGGGLSAADADAIAERLIEVPIDCAGLSLESRLILRQRERRCVEEMKDITIRAQQRLESERYRRRKAKIKKR